MAAADAGIWLEHSYDEFSATPDARREEVYRDVAEHGAAMAIPVWTVFANSDDADEHSLGYFLIDYWLGVTFDCSVQPFEVVHRNNGRSVRILDNEEDPESSLWENEFWIQPETEG